MKDYVVFLSLLSLIANFTFLYPSISVSTLAINRPATYNFYAFRSSDVNLNPTPYSSQLVPGSSKIIVIFPVQYNLTITVPVCTTLLIDDNSISTFSTSIIGNNFTISNAIPSSLAIANVTIIIQNITNPYPAITTDPFLIVIGQDISSSSTTVTLTPAAFQNCTVSFNPAFVNSTAAMVVYVKPTNHMVVGGFLQIQFPSNMQWSQDVSTSHTLPLSTANCSILSGQVTSGSCSGSSATATVQFTLGTINTSKMTQGLSFQINGLFSPPATTPSDTLLITSYSPSGDEIDKCTATITGLIPQVISVSLSPNLSPFFVNSASSITFTFTLTDTLTKSDYFIIVFPTGTVFNYNNIISAVNLLLFTSGVTYTSSNLTLIARQSSASPTRFAGTVCRITVGSYVAPPSVKNTPSFILQVYNAQNRLKMQGSATITAQAKNYPLTISASSYAINQNTVYSFTFTSTDFLTNTSFIILSFPTDITINIAAHCVTSNFSLPANSSCSLNGTNSIRIDNLTTNGISGGTYTVNVQSIFNPNRAVSSLPFSAAFYYINDSSYLVATANFIGLTFTPNQLILNLTTVSLSNYHLLATPVSINITFTAKDAIVTNGYMLISIPSEFSVVTGYTPQCAFISGAVNAAVSCLITGQVFNISFGSRAISANQVVTIGLNNLAINPKNARPTSSFQLYTYSPDGFMVNYLNSSLTVNNFIPIDFSFSSITPSNYNNSAIATYRTYVMQTASWENNSYLIIKIPQPLALTSNTTCTNYFTNSSLICSMIGSNGFNITLPGVGSSLSFQINLKNSPSLRPSSTFNITTYTSDGYIYATNNAISVFTLTASSFPNLTYSFSNPYYNQSTNLTFNIVNSAYITSSYTLTNINQYLSTGSISCLSLTATVSCSISGTNLILSTPTKLPINTDFTIINMFVPMANTTSMTLNSFDATYLMSTYSPIIFQTACSLPCYTCVSPSLPLSCLSCYSTTLFTNKIYYFPNNCYEACPPGTYSSIGSTICSTCTNQCAECTSSSSFCTQCMVNSSTPILYLTNSTCTSVCPSGTFKDNSTNLTKYTHVCSKCVTPCSTCTSLTVCLTCLNASLYYYNTQCLSACPYPTTVANSTTMQCDPCANICLTCVNTTTTCLTCNPAVAPIFYAQKQTCLSTCPTPLVVDGSSCSECAIPCNTCSISKNNCTSCLNGTFLSLILNGTCLNTCEQYYFGNKTSQQCQSCASVPSLNCKNCIDQTRCRTCDSGFVFFALNSSCLTQAPSGYTNISGLAVACSFNCSECISSSYNCTACTGLFSLYTFIGSGYCYTQCPNTTISFSNICVTCTSPCLTCLSSLNNCTSCITGYLIRNNYSFSCIASCPNATFVNPVTSICTNCSAPCLNCLGSALHCTSCLNASLYISNSSCVPSCPVNSLIDYITMGCYPCLTPCLSCSVSANNCTSCISRYYFLASINECYSSCPTPTTVPSPTISFTCIYCTNNCASCSLLADNCTTCLTNYSFYNNTCLSLCPTGFYSNASICKTCVNNCATCTSSTVCLTCTNTTIFYASQCLSSCPINSSIIINKTCTLCSSGCLNCSSTDYCYECPASTALNLGTCVSSCPAPLSIHFNTTSNKLNCFSSSQIAAQNLQNTLQITSILPLPFTIVSTFLFLCCLMSKIQHMDTYIIGVGYSLYGIAEASSLAFLFYIFKIGYFDRQDFSLFSMLIILTLGMIGLLNLISLVCVTPFLTSDAEFNNWLKYKRRGTPQKDSVNQQSSEDVVTNVCIQKQNENVECCSHKCSFAFFTIMSFITSYKFKVIIFTKLFRFNCLTAHLQNVHGFRAFNVLSFFGIVHEGFTCYITIKFLMMFGFSDNKLYLATIDCLIVTLISFLLALISTQKEDDFFKIHNDYKNGIDLGHRKKDKDAKNFKFDEKRIKGMDSRDKLIDVGYEHSQVQEQEIIVNHNITDGKQSKKVGSNWVQVDEFTRKRSPRYPKTKDSHNIFDINAEYDEDRFIPMTQKQRIQLFHTSVIPSKNFNAKQKPIQSRANDWVQVYIGNDLLKDQNIMSDMHRQTFYNRDISQLPLNTQTKQLNMQQSAVKINMSDQLRKTPIQPLIVVSEAKPIIKEANSQYINSKQNSNTSKHNHIQSIPIVEKSQQILIVENNQDLNRTIQQGVIVGSSANKSYQSILPFVHQNGVLKQKKSKITKQQEKIPNKLAIVNTVNQNGLKIENQSKVQAKKQKVDMGVVANSSLLQQMQPQRQSHIRLIEQNQVNFLQQMLDCSDIKEAALIYKTIPKIQKLTQQIQVQNLEPSINQQLIQKTQKQRSVSQKIVPMSSNNIMIIPYSSSKVSKKLAFNKQQLSQKILPQKIDKSPAQQDNKRKQVELKVQQLVPDYRPIVHAPKVYKSDKILNVRQVIHEDSFDKQMMKRQEQLNRIKMQVQRNSQMNRNADAYSKTSRRNKSKQSIKSFIDDAFKSKIAYQSNQLIVKEENSSHANKDKGQSLQEQNQIEVINYESQTKNETIYDGRSAVEEKTVKNANGTSENRRENILYTPSVLSKRTDQPLQSKKSDSSQKNIFDRVVYAQLGHQEDVQKVQDSIEQHKIATQKAFYQNQVSNNNVVNVQQQLTDNIVSNKSEPINYQSYKPIVQPSKQQEIEDSRTEQNNEWNKQTGQQYDEQQNIQQQQENEQAQDKISQNQQINKSVFEHQQLMEQNQDDQIQQIVVNDVTQSNEIEIKQSQYTLHQQQSDQSQHSDQQVLKIQDKDKYKAEQIDQKYEQQRISAQFKQKKVQESANLFMVEYAQSNLEPEQPSNEEFTVQNINQNYIEQVENDYNLQQKHLSLQLKKTSKRIPKVNKPEEHQPIELLDGKIYKKSQAVDEDGNNIPGKIKKGKKNQMIEQQPTQEQASNSEHIIDLLKKVNKKMRNKKSMPKQEKDQRIVIKIDKNNPPKSQQPQQNTNLARKSMEKNKPIKKFEFQHKNEEYGEEQQQETQNYRKSRVTNMNNANLVRPSLIGRSSSMRQPNTTTQLVPKQISYVQENSKKEERMQEIREFNFGDEFSSDRSKQPAASSKAELVKWKEQFVKEGSYVNFQPQDQSSGIPPQPVIKNKFDYDQQLQVIEQRKISRKKSKRSKPNRRGSRQRGDELQRIYGK